MPLSASVDSDGGDPTGQVRLSIDGDPIGEPVDLDDDGLAVGPVLDGLHAGLHTVLAEFTSVPGGRFTLTSAQRSFVMTQAPTTTAVRVTATSVTATVDSGVPGTPTGEVRFVLDGKPLGSATVDGGVATRFGNTSTDGNSVVAAVYSGSADYAASSASTVREDPSIEAALAGDRNGDWYAGPVTVSFTCETGSAAVVCPEPVVLDTEGVDQVVTRTVVADDGGVATVSTGPVNIDLTAPTAAVGRVKEGRTYRGVAPAARCLGDDALSGIATCEIPGARSVGRGLDRHGVRRGRQHGQCVGRLHRSRLVGGQGDAPGRRRRHRSLERPARPGPGTAPDVAGAPGLRTPDVVDTGRRLYQAGRERDTVARSSRCGWLGPHARAPFSASGTPRTTRST